MNKHTPGPWSPARSSQSFWYIDGPQKGRHVAVTGMEASEANARLIAAAPEMLEFLKTEESWIQCDCSQVYPTDPNEKHKPQCARRRVRELIAKAEGESK